jgi:hypothetical protein
MNTSNVIPNRPKVCPICKEENNHTFDIYGPHHDYILELQGTDADMILIRGWYCSDGNHRGVFGTVLGHQINGKIERYVSPDHVYLIMDGDKITS